MIIEPYIFDGEINLCWAFYDHMRYKRRKVINFSEAITYLEDLMDMNPVFDKDLAVRYLNEAYRMAYEK